MRRGKHCMCHLARSLLFCRRQVFQLTPLPLSPLFPDRFALYSPFAAGSPPKGEVGTGKTTLLRSFLSRPDSEGHRTALVFNPCLPSLELLKSINREFGFALETGSRIELLLHPDGN